MKEKKFTFSTKRYEKCHLAYGLTFGTLAIAVSTAALMHYDIARPTNFLIEDNVVVEIKDSYLNYGSSIDKSSLTKLGKSSLKIRQADETSTYIKVNPGTTYSELIGTNNDLTSNNYGLKLVSKDEAVGTIGFYVVDKVNGIDTLIDLDKEPNYVFNKLGKTKVYTLIPKFNYTINLNLVGTNNETLSKEKFDNLDSYIEEFNKTSLFPLEYTGGVNFTIKAVENIPVRLPKFENQSTYIMSNIYNDSDNMSGYSFDNSLGKLTNYGSYYTFTRDTLKEDAPVEKYISNITIDAKFHVKKTFKYSNDTNIPQENKDKEYTLIGNVVSSDEENPVLYGVDSTTGDYVTFEDGNKIISSYSIKPVGGSDSEAKIVGRPGTPIEVAIKEYKDYQSYTDFEIIPNYGLVNTLKTVRFVTGSDEEVGVFHDLDETNNSFSIPFYEGGYSNLEEEFKLFSKYNYQFQGWYTSPDYNESTKVSTLNYEDIAQSSLTLYAKWGFTVYFHTNSDDYMTTNSNVILDNNLSTNTENVYTSTGILSYKVSDTTYTSGKSVVFVDSFNQNKQYKLQGYTTVNPRNLGDNLYKADFRDSFVDVKQDFNGENIKVSGVKTGRLNVYAMWTYDVNYKVINALNDNIYSLLLDGKTESYPILNFDKSKAKLDTANNIITYTYFRPLSYFSDIKGLNDRTLPAVENSDFKFESWNNRIDGTGTSYDSLAKIDETLAGKTLYAMFSYEQRYYVGKNDSNVTYSISLSEYKKEVDSDNNVYFYQKGFYNYENKEPIFLNVEGFTITKKVNNETIKYVPEYIITNSNPKYKTVWYLDSELKTKLNLNAYDPTKGIESFSSLNVSNTKGVLNLYANFVKYETVYKFNVVNADTIDLNTYYVSNSNGEKVKLTTVANQSSYNPTNPKDKLATINSSSNSIFNNETNSHTVEIGKSITLPTESDIVINASDIKLVCFRISYKIIEGNLTLERVNYYAPGLTFTSEFTSEVTITPIFTLK